VVLVISGILLYFWLGARRAMPPAPSAGMTAPVPAAVTVPAARFVGGQACATCHAQEYEAWRASHHAMAMQEANAQTVLGDFGNAHFTEAGVTSTFFTRAGRFYVNTDGPDGALHDYEIKYTFGVEPLQQYLVEFPGGRLQALSIAWDTRPQEAGGQRWFHLYPGEALRAPDPLHWTGRDQTWNYQCAECHSTDLHKNYDIGQNRYATTWAEMMVSCEACHGPGSAHVAWAQARPAGAPRAPAGTTGLTVPLGQGDGSWVMQDSQRGIAQWSGPARSTTELDVCARCHARRRPIVALYPYGRPFRDTHMPALLDAGLYHADGQILGEVYEYGSFIQSRMFRAGVTCSDCHEPHGLGLRAPGNAVCAQCHLPARFDTPEHHHHNVDSDAARCVSCHMPARTYMVVDPRRDHSLQIPRPDLSVALGTPNACTGCHQDQPAAWAAAQVVRWYGASSPARRPHFAAALDAGRRGLLSAEKALAALATDASQDGIARATALALLPEYLSAASLPAVQAALSAADPLVRAAALAATEPLPPAERVQLAAPSLRDTVRAVRLAAAHALAGVPRQALSAVQQADFERALAELVAAETVNADRPEAHLNLANLYVRLGRAAEAEAAFRNALALDPRFVPALVNLADLFRAQGRDADSARVLDQALQVAPDSAEALHALGLLRVRQGRRAEAVDLLRRAAQRQPESTRFAYVYAVALHGMGEPARAIAVLEEAHRQRPANRDLLSALVTYLRERRDLKAALRYAEQLAILAPGDQEVQAMVELLRRQVGVQ
jgi:predicted CXXCH cytochrome family protein